MICRRLLLLAAAPALALADDTQRSLYAFPNENGVAQTLVSTGALDTTGPFFQSLGTNGRTCASCHQPAEGWSVTPGGVRQRFEMTQGTDPIFRTNDGANCANLDVSTAAARRAAYSLLLSKGLIRVELPVPAKADFTVVDVVNPYGCSDKQNVSVYRRPLPSTNLRFLTTVMWDGRESQPGNTLEQNLLHQANSATTGHAQGAALSAPVRKQIVDFEMALTTAQIVGSSGRLDDRGFLGGTLSLFAQPFFVGINDPLGSGGFTPNAFDIFPAASTDSADRLAIARGQQVFNTKPIAIRGVKGLNDALRIDTLQGTCTTCHNTPNVGNHSVPLAIDIGVSDAGRRTPDMPLFLLASKNGREIIQTTDPGRALVTGKWEDIGKTKGPVLRALSGRGPYFHNGSAATLKDVVEFYETRFAIGLTAQEKADLAAFLGSL